MRLYTLHSQLIRFADTTNPPGEMAAYTTGVHEEATRRGYSFDATKIGSPLFKDQLTETRGQLEYEWAHLMRKLKIRDAKRHREFESLNRPSPHPMFRIVAGDVRDWEKMS